MENAEPFGRARLREYLTSHRARLQAMAAAGRPLVLLHPGADAREIFEALGFAVGYPSLDAVMAVLDGSAPTAIRAAEAAGHGSTACGLMKADLGLRLLRRQARAGSADAAGAGADAGAEAAFFTAAPGGDGRGAANAAPAPSPADAPRRAAGPDAAGDGGHGAAPRGAHAAPRAAHAEAPSLVVCPGPACAAAVKWFEALAAQDGAPLVALDVPARRTVGIPASDILYVEEQLRELAARAERIARRPLDPRRLRDVVRRSRRIETRWVRLQRRDRAAPAPFDALAEGAPLMIPALLGRGTHESLAFYDGLLRDLGHQPHRRSERFRVLFDGPPPWFALDELGAAFARWGATVVVAPHTRSAGVYDDFRHDPDDPWRSMAAHALSGWRILDLDLRRRWLLDWAREYRCDAVIIHAAATCRVDAPGQLQGASAFAGAGLPVLSLQSDLADERHWRAAAVRERLDGFFHELGGRPRRRDDGKAAA